MPVVFNHSNTPIHVTELRKIIPADHKPYVLPWNIIRKYSDRLFVVPDSFIREMEAEKRRLKIIEEKLYKQIQEYEIELKIINLEKKSLYDEKEELRTERNKLMNDILNNKRKSEYEPMDFLYSYAFNNDVKSIERLRYSIKSIIKQKVKVCVCNTSKECIYDQIKDLGMIKYVHKPLDGNDYSKAKNINIGVDELVESEYFFISDIDLIYPRNFIKEMVKFTTYEKPVRVVFHNYNLGQEFYSTKISEYKNEFKLNKDISRQSFGIAPGNGMIHLQSFKDINGFDEGFVGYGPEDAEFNFRIKYINEYIEVNNDKVNTYHLFHERPLFGTKHRENFLRYKKSLDRIREEIKKNGFSIDIIKASNEN